MGHSSTCASFSRHAISAPHVTFRILQAATAQGKATLVAKGKTLPFRWNSADKLSWLRSLEKASTMALKLLDPTGGTGLGS